MSPSSDTFKKLIPKPDLFFSFKKVSLFKVQKDIKKLKLPNELGMKDMTSRVMKDTPNINNLASCHLMNTIIRLI